MALLLFVLRELVALGFGCWCCWFGFVLILLRSVGIWFALGLHGCILLCTAFCVFGSWVFVWVVVLFVLFGCRVGCLGGGGSGLLGWLLFYG